MRSNCLFWALRQWRREGGYLLIRRSRWGPFPHFLWAPEPPPSVQSFKPLRPEPRWTPKVYFNGRVETGD